MQEKYKAIIVGGGYMDSMQACELAEKGESVLMLETGSRDAWQGTRKGNACMAAKGLRLRSGAMTSYAVGLVTGKSGLETVSFQDLSLASDIVSTRGRV